MNKKEALEELEVCQEDFDEIQGILADPNMTPSEKCDAISEIVEEGEIEEEE